ncbi:MAG: DM13 domain-containing protein [Myxococcota bacterium]
MLLAAFALLSAPLTAHAQSADACGKTHVKVGQTATLTNKAHGIGGTVTILDDCRAEIRDFTYDGRGVSVKVYGALGGKWRRGFAMSQELVRMKPYAGETVALRLPKGKTWDDLDGVSVWCIDFAIDFGNGTFE